MSTLVQKATFTTELNADSTEWCPIDDNNDLVVCATYQLLKTKNNDNIDVESETRVGCLYLLKFTNTNPNFLKLLQKISMPGILDCKWCHVKLQNNIYLALVNAVGELRILKLLENDNEDDICLSELQTIKVTSDQETLLLSLDWSTGITYSDIKIIVSSSLGNITIFSYKDGSFDELNTWKLHNFEAWTVAFNYWDINVFFSGGDDCKLNCFDTRVGQVVKSNRTHNAGVTSMHKNFKQEYCFITGSYDETVLFWDIRNMKSPVDKMNLGGGVWRLKWEPKTCDKICASCMYFGSVIIDVSKNKVITEYKEHKSINYGIDWSSLSEKKICENFNIIKNENYRYYVITVCSFYDNLLSLVLHQVPK